MTEMHDVFEVAHMVVVTYENRAMEAGSDRDDQAEDLADDWPELGE